MMAFIYFLSMVVGGTLFLGSSYGLIQIVGFMLYIMGYIGMLTHDE